MVKKRGKAKPISEKVVKKSKALKKAKPQAAKQEAKAEAPKPMKEALHELEILAEEKRVEGKINGVERKEEDIEKKETQIITEEKKIEKETENVQKIEKEIKKEVTIKPLRAIGIKDLSKGIIGAFIGVVAHFAFIYGKQIASDITAVRATILFTFSYLLIIILMYETGYREIKEKRLLGILPKRATAIYFTSLVMIPIIFFLFNQLNLSNLTELYKQIAVTSVLSSVGAGTADLIGRD
ncbi:DUF2391 family protein [Candidatus Woesearchaeota archaeon]|nr:DUF2391 family protein [Candidatus Woesearchaeota archaeon]